MRVLVTGANGFIGGFVVIALRDAGHDVIAAARRPRRDAQSIACDLGRDTDPAVWMPRLDGVDAVANCAGILRETRTDTFENVHVAAPLALFRACAARGVRRIVQISALGEPEDGAFIDSKHRCDAALLALDLDACVLRPSLVCSAEDAYGGTSLLRALAALPGVLLLPGPGRKRVRPVLAEDLARAVVAALGRAEPPRGIVEVVGPDVLTLRDYLLAWRRWFGLPPPIILCLPRFLEQAAVALGESFGRGPLCRVIANLLERERIGAADAPLKLERTFGFVPTSLAAALACRPVRAVDLLAARWYTLRIMLLCIFGFTWFASGALGFALPPAAAYATLPGWPMSLVDALRAGASAADLGVGALLLSGRATRWALGGALAMTIGYVLAIGLAAPAHWLDPLGGLLKNLPIAACLAALLLLEPRR
ncbi:MAG TPA: SDR family oxidoreductase [Rudaea sp.]|nr:SDR family oxidoreductase [Rudaea sp.]